MPLNLGEYGQLIAKFLDAGYRFTLFPQADEPLQALPVVLMRHDIDFGLSEALRMAEYEASVGIRTTYFAQLRSPLYNVLSRDGSEALRRIADCGHDIGLHFAFRDNPASDPWLGLGRDLELLADVVGDGVIHHVISLHQPGTTLQQLALMEAPHGISHTYERRLTHDVSYFSDSGGRFRFGHPVESEAYSRRASVQVLIHPMWWVTSGEQPLDKLREYLRTRAISTISLLERSAVTFDVDPLRYPYPGDAGPPTGAGTWMERHD